MKINILVIDDLEEDAKLVKVFLKQASLKHEFFYAETLYEGIEICEEKEVDLVLLDLGLPDSRGLRTLSGFLDRSPRNIPVIVMTGTSDEMVGEQAVKSGAQDYLVKGEFEYKLLARAIRQTLARHRIYKELEKMNRELNVIKIRFDKASKMANFGDWEIDIVTNEMIWSDQVYKIFGFEPGRFTPSRTDYLNYVHPDDRDMVQNTFEKATRDGALHKIEYRVRVGTNPIQHVANQFQVYYNDTTERTLLAGVLHDITERKRSEELLAQHKISEGTSRMKEEILEDMSFHIRTPLSSLVNLSYILNASGLNEEQEESVKALQQSVGDLSLAVNNMLNFSVLLSDKITVEEEQFTVANTIQGLVKMFQIKANRKSITLQVDTDENLPKYLIGDETKVNQILYNILDNAIKYTEHGGRVEFIVEAPKIEMGKAQIAFKVEDNGLGMSKQKMEEILDADRLLNMNEEEKKKGLGLAIATRLTETMGGELKVASEEGEGTTFTVEFGFNIADVAAQQIGGEPIRPMRILFIEDHFLNQIATKRVLTMWSDHVSVDIADNGKIGVEKYEANDYDVILMDLQMPVMNGFEATAQIRTLDSNIPIIALSANTSKTEAEKCFTTGINDYLAKPYDPEELKGKIMTLVYRKSRRGEE